MNKRILPRLKRYIACSFRLKAKVGALGHNVLSLWNSRKSTFFQRCLVVLETQKLYYTSKDTVNI